MPAWPAYLLLFASIPLLVPTLARRLGDRLRGPHQTTPIARKWIALAAVLTLAVPAVATVAAERIEPPTPAIVQTTGSTTTILTPVDGGIELHAERVGTGQQLTWTSKSRWRANVFFRVYRTAQAGPDIECVTAFNVSWECVLRSVPIATTREPVYVDPDPPAGATYRVGLGTNWADDPEQGDVFVFTPPVSGPR